MAQFARLALVPLTLAAAAAPAIAQADAAQKSAMQPASLLGSFGTVELYPLTALDPLSNTMNLAVAGTPIGTVGVPKVISDGLLAPNPPRTPN